MIQKFLKPRDLFRNKTGDTWRMKLMKIFFICVFKKLNGLFEEANHIRIYYLMFSILWVLVSTETCEHQF